MKRFFGKKKYIIIFLFTILLSIFATVAYAAYVNSIFVQYSATSGEMICNANVEKDESYIINGIPYIIVTVKNYDENGNITSVDIEFSLTIKNKDGGHGTFIWQKINEDDNSKYDEGTSNYLGQTTTNIYSFGNVKKEEKKFKIFIKSEQSSQEELDFDVELNSAQKDMQQ